MNQPYKIAALTAAVLIISLLLPETIALIVSAAFFAVVTWLNPKWIIPLLIVYFPVRPFLVEVNPGLKLAGDIAIIILVLRVIWDSRRDPKSIFQLAWYEWAYIVWCLFGGLVALKTGVTPAAIIFQLRKFIMMYLVFYGVKRLKWDRSDLFVWANITAVMAVVLSVHGVIERISNRQILLPQAWKEMLISPTNADRIYGLIGNPNSFALFLSVAFLGVTYLYTQTHHRMYRVLQVLFMGMLLLTFSRGTWIAFTITFIAYAIATRQKIWLKQIPVLALVGFILVYTPVHFTDLLFFDNKDEPGGLRDRFAETFDNESLNRSGQSGRIFFIKKGFEILFDHPVTGTGFATFGDSATLAYGSPIYEKYGLADIYAYKGKTFFSDNQYIQIIAQTGVIGVILFAIFLLHMLYRIWSVRKEHPIPSYIIASFWLFICIAGVFYNIWENNVFAMYFFMAVGWFEAYRSNRVKR
ncbi:MAG: O-antigen ligase family protein [Bacillaceae bacterium]|nr:O-antigen ligase family protein [Bacillaceae bacterium]